MLLYSMLSTGFTHVTKKASAPAQTCQKRHGRQRAIVLHHIDAPEICALGGSRRDKAGAAGGGGVGKRCIRPASHRRHRRRLPHGRPPMATRRLGVVRDAAADVGVGRVRRVEGPRDGGGKI